MRLGSISEVVTYYAGKVAGVTLFVWWKDGTQYVGTTGTLLSQVLLEVNNELNLALEDLSRLGYAYTREVA